MRSKTDIFFFSTPCGKTIASVRESCRINLNNAEWQVSMKTVLRDIVKRWCAYKPQAISLFIIIRCPQDRARALYDPSKTELTSVMS